MRNGEMFLERIVRINRTHFSVKVKEVAEAIVLSTCIAIHILKDKVSNSI